jgi:hypothetical protein
MGCADYPVKKKIIAPFPRQRAIGTGRQGMIENHHGIGLS